MIPQPTQTERLSHGLLAITADLLWVYGQRFIIYNRLEILNEGEEDLGELVDTQMPI